LLSLASIKLANPGSPGKMAVKTERENANETALQWSGVTPEQMYD